MPRFVFLYAFATCVLLPCDVLAQRGYTALTAEYLAATSDLIVRATISDLKFEEFVPENGQNEASATSVKSVTVLLDVTRCLKGMTDDSIKFQVTEFVGNERLAKWKESELELFWFFDFAEIDENGIRRIVPRGDDVRWGPGIEPPDLNADRPPIMLLNVDLQPLTTEKMVEDSIIHYVEQFGTEKTGGVRESISWEVASRTGMHQAANVVMLPMNYKELRSK